MLGLMPAWLLRTFSMLRVRRNYTATASLRRPVESRIGTQGIRRKWIGHVGSYRTGSAFSQFISRLYIFNLFTFFLFLQSNFIYVWYDFISRTMSKFIVHHNFSLSMSRCSPASVFIGGAALKVTFCCHLTPVPLQAGR